MSKVSWKLIKAGNKREIEKIVEQYYRVAYKVAHWWAKTGKIEESEAIGLANIALMKCVTRCTFDEDRGIQFSTYLGTAVNNEIRMYLRKDRKRKSNVSVSLDQPLPQYGSFCPYENVTYGDSILDEVTLEDSLEDKILFDEAYTVLHEAAEDMTDVELRCLVMLLLGSSVKDISISISKSQNHTRKILHSAQHKLREKHHNINTEKGVV